MEPERWQRIEQLFHSAVECDPTRRASFLDEACAGDIALRQEVVSLLASHEKEDFTRTPAPEEVLRVLEERESQSLAGRNIGPYRVIRRIGQGGMGEVFLASRADESFRKEVAIKLVRRGLDSEDVVRRFRSERQILASLDHPNITRLLDGGATEEGLPYFVMEHIQGEPIDKYCDRHRLSITERLRLFLQVCAAVHYAHQNLVIHRDIKPGNVLVTEKGVPRLLDFGIAKLLSPSHLSPTDDVTITLVRPMTPEYASPEQARGEPITTASDVYSLGVLLYKLLTGHPPYRLASTHPEVVQRAICQELPQNPSTVIYQAEEVDQKRTITAESVSSTREGTPEKLQRRLRGDLDNIVLMALHKEPPRRYASVLQFSDDIRRHLDGLPVIARRDTARYRAAKFVGRHKTGVATAAAIFLTLASGIVATTRQARIAAAERDRARLEKTKADHINAFLQDMLGFSDTRSGSANTKKGHDATLADMLDEAGPRAEKELDDQPAVKAELLRTIGTAYTIQPRFDLAEHYLREALDTDLKLYGAENQETARTTFVLGVALGNKGDYTSAEQLFRQSLTVYRKRAKDADLNVSHYAENLDSLALVMFRVKGEYREAESLLLEAVALSPRLTGRDRTHVASAENFLAALHADRGDYQGAESWGRKSVEENLKLGSDRFQAAECEVNLGSILRATAQYPEAERLLQDGLALYRKLLGEEHPSVAYAWAHLGLLHYLEGKYELAEEEIRKSVKIYEAKLPKGHGATTSPYTTLGLILNKTGRSREAEMVLRDTLQIRNRILPKGHYLIAITEGALGECLTTQRRYAEAEPLLEESYDTLKSVQGEQSPLTLEVGQRLATLYQSWGKAGDAERFQSLRAHSSQGTASHLP